MRFQRLSEGVEGKSRPTYIVHVVGRSTVEDQRLRNSYHFLPPYGDAPMNYCYVEGHNRACRIISPVVLIFLGLYFAFYHAVARLLFSQFVTRKFCVKTIVSSLGQKGRNVNCPRCCSAKTDYLGHYRETGQTSD